MNAASPPTPAIDPTTVAIPPATDRPRKPYFRRRRVWIALAIVLIFVVGITAFVIARQPDTRPLDAKAEANLKAKITALEQAGEPQPAVVGTFETDGQRQDETAPYQPGARKIILTEREINHLLREEIGLGEQVRVALRDNQVAVYADIPVEEEAPLLGGRTVRLRGLVRVEEHADRPMLALADLTVWGVSLPNDWLGGLKNRNLLEVDTASGKTQPSALARGIENLRVHAGRIEIELAK